MERKRSLRQEQKELTDMTAVDEAATWADLLVRREHRGPGDTLDAARNRAARKHQLPERALWSLRYRPPKDLAASVYRTLQRAYEAEVRRQEAKLRHELEITKAYPRTPALDAVIRETEALLEAMDRAKAGAASERAGTTPTGED